MLDFLVHLFLSIPPLLVYLLIAVILLLESSAVPIANTTMLLFAGALASLGYFNIWVLTILSIIGSTLGACSAYYLGYKGGRPLLLRITKIFRVPLEKVEIAERWFHKSGPWMIFIARITPYIRPFACVLAGVSRIPFGIFFLAASTGSIVWCIGVLAIGWYMGSKWEIAARFINAYTIPAVIAIVILAASFLILRSILQKRLERRLKQTYLQEEQSIKAEEFIH